MGNLEKEIKQVKFQNEQTKANLNVMFTANWINNEISILLKPYNLTHEQYNALRILRGSHPGVFNSNMISIVINKKREG